MLTGPLAVSAGTLSTSAADTVRVGLGCPSDSVPATALAIAAEHLCAEAANNDADLVGIHTRQLRDQIDETGLADREQARAAARSLHSVKQADGMARLVWVMDPETAANVSTLCDRGTSPTSTTYTHPSACTNKAAPSPNSSITETDKGLRSASECR